MLKNRNELANGDSRHNFWCPVKGSQTEVNYLSILSEIQWRIQVPSILLHSFLASTGSLPDQKFFNPFYICYSLILLAKVYHTSSLFFKYLILRLPQCNTLCRWPFLLFDTDDCSHLTMVPHLKHLQLYLCFLPFWCQSLRENCSQQLPWLTPLFLLLISFTSLCLRYSTILRFSFFVMTKLLRGSELQVTQLARHRKNM